MPYEPTVMPVITSAEDLARYVRDEFQRIAESQQETVALDLRPVNVAPLRPREGMIVFADGTSWDPGAGAGSYEYRGGAWIKL